MIAVLNVMIITMPEHYYYDYFCYFHPGTVSTDSAELLHLVLLTILFLYLFDNTVSCLEYIVSNGRMISE
jgi:hypothetical protein